VQYIGFDLPENALIQDYYLSCAFTGGAFTLLPNFELPKVKIKADLIINLGSLSEMPRETILEYLKQIDRIGRLFFFHENLAGERGDSLHGIPISEFPQLTSFTQVSSSISRWPRYQGTSYPCEERVFIHKSKLLKAYEATNSE
jgi:hypothetical protein